MTQRIDKLTPDQTARFDEWVQKWLEIGLSTDPADFEKATAAALRAYALCNLKRPMVVLRMSSPYGVTLGGALAWRLLRDSKAQVWDQVGAQVWDQVGAQVRDQVWAQVWDQVGDQVRAQVWAQVGDQVGAQVRDQVWDQVGAQVRDQVWAQVRDQVGDQVGALVGDQVWAQVRDQVWDQVRDQVGDQVGALVWAQVRDQVWAQVRDQVGGGLSNSAFGQLWSEFAAWVSYFRDVAGWESATLDRFTILEDLAKSCGWVWWHENVLAISDRPCSLQRDEQGRLHSATGPAISYRDGWGFHAWHGLVVPAHFVEDRDKINVTTIHGEQNMELRRVLCEIVGWDRAVAMLGAQEVAVDTSGNLPRRLLDVSLGGRDKARLVDVQNGSLEPDGSRRRFLLGVPDSVKTPAEAIAWSYGINPECYREAIRT